ncbi:methionine synthase [Micromonospora sp. DR5-3]|uniref:methionine synthase n=1 Tax=unclassified Micromonospora TaxID=2617518 RepID=UPI0011D850A7|nr:MULTISPECIES: methionine synthase [unclassified Micromonospora]MCW3818471.1 methionine synthase [Micromonospora sp. DR5-3]TYC23210.1 methionine synthase [Micromonospora sp. MP36]
MSDQPWPWPAGAATGIGSLPGTDIAEAQRIVLGELPVLPHLPELPARGPGADLIGRTAGLLVELPVELFAARWRVAPRPGKDLRRARDLMERDLDQLAEQAEEYTGPVKVQAAGPFTLAASVELPIGGRMIRDPGAVRDLAGSLAEGLRGHVEAVARRLPRASVLLQLDEPSLPAALAGRVPTESGFGTYRAVEPEVARGLLRDVVEATGVPTLVHCCAPDVPLELIRTTGAAGVALDLELVTDLDPLGEAIDAGLGLLAGAAPALPPPAGRAPTSAQVADRVRRVWDQLGFPRRRLAEQVVVTPACGLAGATPAYARAVLAACRDAGRRLAEE